MADLTIRAKRGTRSAFEAGTQLQEGEFGYITDEDLLVIGNGSDANEDLDPINGVLTGSGAPTQDADDYGGVLYYDSDDGDLYYSNGTSWVKCGMNELSELSGDLDDINDGTTYQRVTVDYVDASGKITNIKTNAGNDASVNDGAVAGVSVLWTSDKIDTDYASKAGGTSGDVLTDDGGGEPQDSGTQLSALARRAAAPTLDNVATLDTDGDPTDSGVGIADVARRADSPTNGNIANVDTEGDPVDSGKKVNDSGATTNDIWTANKINEAIDNALDGLDWQESVLDRIDLTTSEPTSPSEGDRYINTATGDSSETTTSVTEDYIYEWDGSAWTEIVPNEGFTTRVEDEDIDYVFNGTDWVSKATGTNHNSLSGIQGGTDSEYYHLTSAEHSAMTGGVSSDADSYHTHDSKQDDVITTEGDIVRGDGSGEESRLGVGSDGEVLTADSGEAGGLTWSAIDGGTF